MRELYVSDVHTGERLTRYQLGPGLVVLGDRAFANAPALVATRACGAHVVVRRTPQYLKLWSHTGVRFDLVAALQAAGSRPQVSFALVVRAEQSGPALPVWIHALHL